MTALALIARWREGLIVVLMTLLVFGVVLYKQRGQQIQKLKADHAAYVTEQQLLLAQANTKARTIETSYQAKLSEANQHAINQIKAANDAATRASAAVTSLREQTRSAASKLPTATQAATIDYAIACGDILGAMAEEGRRISAAADQHAIDAKRVVDSWPE